MEMELERHKNKDTSNKQKTPGGLPGGVGERVQLDAWFTWLGAWLGASGHAGRIVGGPRRGAGS